MNPSAVFRAGPEHYEREITSSGGNSYHRSPRETGHSRASSESFSLRTASRIPGPPSYPTPVSIANLAYENLQKEQDQLGLEPTESNKVQHVQAGKRDLSRQTEKEFLQIIEQMDAEIQDLQAERAQRVQQHETHMEHMQASYTVAIQQRDAFIVQLRQDNSNFERTLRGLSGECSRLQSVALTAQAGALRAMEKGGWVPKEDRVVRDELEKLQDGLRSWAKKYSRATVTSDFECVSARQKDKVVEELKGYCVQTDWRSLLERMPISLNKVPLVLVQALLARKVFQNLIGDPFFAFPETVDDPELPNRAGMQRLYRTMMQLNKAEAQIWRSQMIRVLSASLTDSNVNGPSIPDRLQKMASFYAKDFIDGPAQFLLREPESQAGGTRRSDDLHRLYYQAGELALSLWAQRTALETYDQQRLHDFNSSSPLMMAHRLHHFDEDDKRSDGKRILLCTQPAVLAFGNENGEDYDKSKVWAKAVVLIEGDAKPQIGSSTRSY